MSSLRSMITSDFSYIVILMAFLWLLLFITIHYLAGRITRECQCHCDCTQTKDKENRP